jgi:hypothetical protein
MDNTAFHVFIEDSGIVHRGVLEARMIHRETVSIRTPTEVMNEDWD